MNVDVGMNLPEWSLDPVDPEKMKILAAILRDPNPIHWDRSEVANRGFGDRVINQGPTNLGYVMNMLMDWAGPTAIKRVQVRFTSNVFEGDHVTAGGVVAAVDVENGLAECEIWLDRSDGTRALSGTARVAIA